MMENMRVHRLAILLFLIISSVANSQQQPQSLAYNEVEHWQEVCKKALAEPLTVPSFPGISADKLATCDETALYYGFTGKPDYAAALECGWYERAHPKENEANMFYGPGVLTMLYANGKGTPRNYELAIRFACEQTWAAEAEQELRIGHLEYLRDSKAQSTTFDLCDDITSGLNQGACSLVESRRADAKRELKMASVVRSLSPNAKALLPALRQAEKAFEQTRVDNEIDFSGTARSAFEFEDETRLREQFVINLERFGRGDVPAATPADLAQLDRQLNAVYQQIQQIPAKEWYGTVKPDGIRRTQRKWLALADEWARFARVAYPDLSPETVRAQLIRLRLDQLRHFVPRE